MDLAGPAPSPLEALLVERVVACWLAVSYYEGNYHQNLRDGMSLTQSMYHQKRITLAHNRYLSAIKTLAQVRRLALPVMQVNIGESQINVATPMAVAAQT